MNKHNGLESALEQLLAQNNEPLLQALQLLMNTAMAWERQSVLQAEPYERSEGRQGYANGYKPKTLLTRLGSMKLSVPQTRGIEFYPSIIEKGQRSERALMLAMAEMYVHGTSTRKVKAIVEELCGQGVSSTQVSRAVELLDEVLEPWRTRLLSGEPIEYLYLDATYEKVRRNGVVQDAAVLTAYGVTAQGTRRVLGLSVAISEAEVHWRSFLESLTARGLAGLKLIISDAHVGLQKARTAVFPSVPWQRCQFHLQQNAQAFSKRIEQRKEIAATIRPIFQAPSKAEADRLLKMAVDTWQPSNPKFAEWLDLNIPEGLTCMVFPESHRKKIRTTNLIERNNREIKRRTKVATLFTSEKSLERLVTALLMEQDENWMNGRIYLTMSVD